MGYQPYPFPSLGAGLNLKAKADAVSPDEAIDCIDTEYTETGAVKERAGTDNYTTSALTNRAASLEPFYTTGGLKHLIAGCGTRLEAITDAGTVTSLTGLTDGTWDFARFGGPNNERIYAGQGSGTLRRWDGSAWSAISNTPQAGALAVMSRSNRLVAGRFNGTAGGPTGGASTSSPSHVYFSAAGDPETWGTDDFLQFYPGDGEKVQAVIAWRDLVFVFKETKFFVIHGESQDSGGDPVFDFYPVEAGVGLVSPRAVAAGPQGVYFLDRRGVFITTGQDPVLLSDPAEPIFRGGASPFYTGGDLAQANITNCAAHFHNDRLYLAFPTDTANDRVLVWDEPGKWWSLYDLPMAAMTTFRISNDPELVYARASGDNHIDRHNSSLTSDNGSAITSHWRGGFADLGSTEQKRVAEVKVWGSGDPYVALSTDFTRNPGTLLQLDLNDPDAPQWGGFDWGEEDWATPKPVIPAIASVSGEGTHFSPYFENSALDNPWAAHRLNYHVAGLQVPSVIGN